MTTAADPQTAPGLNTTIELTDEDLARYDEKGYWISPRLIDDDTIASLRRAHEDIWSGRREPGTHLMFPFTLKSAYGPHELRKLDNGWWVNDTIRSLVTSEVLGSIARQLMRAAAARLWHDQVIYKPVTGASGNATNIGWHQDCGYWKAADTTNMVTAWVALQDTDLTNGGMRSIAGSHRWGLIEDSDTFFDQDLDGLKDRYGHLGEWADEPCILPAGCASFHHGLCFHGSGPNQSQSPRLSVVAHLMPDGTGYSGSDQWHGNVTLLGPRPQVGEPFTGRCFPLVGKG